MSAPNLETRRHVFHRDSEHCVACSTADGLTFQHRRAVGMGGSKFLPSPVDGLTLCATCNAACEGSMQSRALSLGWKVPRWADPALVPVYYPNDLTWCVLIGTGRKRITETVALDRLYSVYGASLYDQWVKEANR